MKPLSALGLCPDNRTSGIKVLGRGTRRAVNHAAAALRRTYLGARRRLRAKLGTPKAIAAMAHRLVEVPDADTRRVVWRTEHT